MKEKIVFLNFVMDPTGINVFKPYSKSGVEIWGAGTIAAKYGAVGVLVRSLAINNNNYPHTEVTAYHDFFLKSC